VKATTTSRNDAASNALPFLIPREEAAFCPDWNESHDVAAPEQLIGSRLHPIAGVAVARRGYGMPTQHRVTEGYTGLMRAACRHYAARAVTFVTYGTLVVQAAQQSILCASPSLQARPADIEIGTAMPSMLARRQRAPAGFIS